MLKKKSFYWVTLAFLLISSKGSLLFYDDIFWFLLILYIIFIDPKNVIRSASTKFFVGTSLGFLALSVIQYLLNTPDSQYLVSNILFLFKYILLTYLVANFLKHRLIDMVVLVMRDLAYIGLAFFALQLISFDTVFSVASSVTSLYTKANPDPSTKNLLVFNLSTYHKIRNSGFAWEPGAYGCFLVLTLLLSLIRDKFKLGKTQYLFLFSILTTLSTTAYLGLLVVIVCYLRARKVKILTMLLYMVPVLIVVMNVSFLSSKIQSQIFNDLDMIDNLSTRSEFYSNEGSKMPLNRFASMIFITTQFGYKLIWGMSNKYENYFIREFAVNLSNGDFDLIARFGLIGLTFYLSRVWAFFRAITNREMAFYSIFTLLVLGYAENILLLPFFLIFIFAKKTYFVYVVHRGARLVSQAHDTTSTNTLSSTT
ncbi:hypothetical protein [Pedobacter sp. SYP-B3415]|uniref:hypothetical protein n=1 Tax=Pedobacter sp. SYP-B3415 TaxID=2496641 RepID=UPI00101E03C0|nr:hypothetical protein [Pedobacter sp. SYP-B3415]